MSAIPLSDDLSAPASVTLPGGGGGIGLCFCPGRGEAGLSRDGRADRLGRDLDLIRDWGAEALVTLMPEEELSRLGVGGLGGQAVGRGLAWFHLPIQDMEAPAWSFEHRWVYAGTRLRALLRRGGRVMLHCRAGLGRTGTIAARLLVELGVPPAEAVAQVRHARPGAIQTAAQERHVMGIKRVSEKADRLFARRLAALLGGAVGDAFAFSLLQRPPAVAALTLRQPVFQDGLLRVSDDTQLSLFTLEGLIRGLRARQGEDDASLLKQMRLSWQDWLLTQGGRVKLVWHASHLLRHASLHARRQPGLSLLASLEKGAGGSPEAPINACQACGGAQRVGPIALLPGMTRERAFDLALRAAACTHGHPDGYLPAGMLAALLTDLLGGASPRDALAACLPLLTERSGHQGTLAALNQALTKAGQVHFGRSARGLPPALSGPGALAVGFYAAVAGRDFHEALHLASDPEHGSDSAAAIAGQLLGAWRGLEAIPHEWARSLDVRDALGELLFWAAPQLRRVV